MTWFSDRYFWRQCFVLSADLVSSISTGCMLSFPAVLNPAILSPNSTDIRATSSQASSIAGSQGLAGAVGLFFLPFCMHSIGRKAVHIIINALIGTGFFIFAMASNIPALYAGRLLQGLIVSGVYVTSVIVAEYSDPKRRGYSITLKKGSVAVGCLVCHFLGIYLTWRQVAIFAFIPNIIAIIMTLFWPESPSYLAMRGRYDECKKSYYWLFGECLEHKQNLEDIISAQSERRTKERNKKRLTTSISKMCKKDYVIPFLTVNLLTLIIDCCGRHYMAAYVVEILIEITGNKSVATLCTLGSDLLTVLALVSSCFIINSFKRRKNLFSFGAAVVILMFLTSIITYMRSNNHITVGVWLIPTIILTNVFIINAGVIPTCFTIIGEIIPLEHKESGLFTTGIFFTLLYAAVLKCTPIMMEHTGVQGTFAIYATLNLIGFVILYFILIETKDKTLQQIEDELKGVKKRHASYSNTNEQPLMGPQTT